MSLILYSTSGCLPALLVSRFHPSGKLGDAIDSNANDPGIGLGPMLVIFELSAYETSNDRLLKSEQRSMKTFCSLFFVLCTLFFVLCTLYFARFGTLLETALKAFKLRKPIKDQRSKHKDPLSIFNPPSVP
jgi:hypothetical protein